MHRYRRLLLLAGSAAVITGVATYVFHYKTLSDLNTGPTPLADQYRELAAARRATTRPPPYSPALDTKLRDLKARHTEASLPYLYQDLENPERWRQWDAVVHYIAIAGRGDDSATAVIKFIESDYVPPDLDDRDLGFFYKAKFNGLRPLGAIGGPVATDFLMQVWKGDKAKELTEKWYAQKPALVPQFYEPAIMEQLLRGRAVAGLAVAQDPLIRQQMFEAYTVARDQLRLRLEEKRNIPREDRVFTTADIVEKDNVSDLAEALAFYDMVAARGIDAFWRTMFAGDHGHEEIGHYYQKYRFPYWEY